MTYRNFFRLPTDQKEFYSRRGKPVEEIEKNIQKIRPHLSIKKDTYINTKTKCTFIDSEYGEFQAKPVLVSQGKTDHPIRGKQKLRAGRLLSVDKIEARIQKNSPHISIKKETYTEIKNKCTFIDSEYGEWQTTPDSVLSGCQHPDRANNNRKTKKTKTSKEVEEAVQKNSPFISLIHSTYTNTHTNATWIDEKYGEWVATACNVLRGKCHPSRFSNTSKGEVELRIFCQSYVAELRHNSKILKNYELDIYAPAYNFAVEYHGVYWHSEKKVSRDYHQKKLKACIDNGITLLQIYSDEWEFKQSIVKSIIKAKLGISANKYQARKLEIKEVPSQEAQDFLKENHLMGEYRSAKHLGLYAQETLVSLLSYKKHRGGIDIARFCNKLDTSVAGGLSRLLKDVERREQPPFIQSWVDLRYGSGESLTKLGFKHLRTTLGWKWTDGVNTYNRLKCRANMDSRRLTEKQHAQELGWVKIYDAGQALFVKE